MQKYLGLSNKKELIAMAELIAVATVLGRGKKSAASRRHHC